MSDPMYGLPEDIALEFFVGLNLDQICIGAGDIILRFQRGVSLSMYCDLTFCEIGRPPAVFPCHPLTASVLTKLLNYSIVMASRKNHGTLILEFSNGNSLAIHDSNEGYESYVINNGDKAIVV